MATLARFSGFATDSAGNTLASPTVEVRNEATSALAPLFSDRAGASGIANPFTGGSDGSIGFHVAGGAYKITVTSGAISSSLRYAAVGTGGEQDIDVSSPWPTIAAAIGFSVHKNGTTQSGVVSATTTQVTWSTETYDAGNYFVSNVWTPPAGKVALRFSFIADGTITAGTAVNAIITKNGATTIFKQTVLAAATNVAFGFVSIEDIANGTDVYGAAVVISTSSGSATIRGGTTDTYFMGHWIGT